MLSASVTPLELVAGVALDLALGDPRWLPHPVRALGWWIARQEGFLPRTTGGGVALLLITVATASLVVWLTLPWLTIVWIWLLLALRSLDLEATRVLRDLERGDLAAARASLAMIVGRDTEALDEHEILRAAIETMAENLSDAVVAPLFYLLLGGPVAMAAYKAVNTLDSMVGHRNDRYREFGRASARMDDLLNFVPARLTAALVWLYAAITGNNVRRSISVTLRDAAKQPSPNSGYPEAAVAGALGVRLGGLNFYHGVESRREFLGDTDAPLDRAAFAATRRILYGTSALMVTLCCAVLA